MVSPLIHQSQAASKAASETGKEVLMFAQDKLTKVGMKTKENTTEKKRRAAMHYSTQPLRASFFG
jgi:hypothetical protein